MATKEGKWMDEGHVKERQLREQQAHNRSTRRTEFVSVFIDQDAIGPSSARVLINRAGLPRRRTTGMNPEALQQLARRHLWMHFTCLGAYQHHDVPIITRGEGCYVWDQHGNRYLDGLSALFCVNIGHGRADVAQAGADQAKELGFFPTWSCAHPRAIELAAKIASLTPGDLNRVFFTSGGSEAVEAALKLARQYHRLTGNPNKTKFISREIAYHGASLGALAVTGIPDLRAPFEPLVPGGCHVPNTNTFRPHHHMQPEDLAEIIRDRILFEKPGTVAAVILEPVQNAGGCFVPPEGYWRRVREICDEFGVLLISDEVICAWASGSVRNASTTSRTSSRPRKA